MLDLLSSNYDPDDQHHALPSIEDVLEPHIKTEPGLLLSTPSSSSPPIARSESEDQTPDSSPLPTFRSRSASSTFSQLIGTNVIFGDLKDSRETDDEQTVKLSSDTDTDTDNNDNNDNRSTSSSPCPRRNMVVKVPKLATTSHHFNNTHTIKNKKPLRRALDFDIITVQDTSKKRQRKVQSRRQSPDIPNLKELRHIERTRPHLWDADERTLLTVIYRWYKESDSTTIPKVFNKITGLDLRLHIV
jgi:hypothetical protein